MSGPGGEVLGGRDRRLVRLTAAIVLGAWDELAALRREAPPGEPDRAWREAVLQTHLFAGFPRLVEAYEVLERAGGLGEPEADEGEEGALGLPARRDRGAELFDAIYRDQAAGVRERLAAYHPDYGDWIADHAYGRVLSRPGLAPRRRELCAVVALAVTGQDRQLASHARGAVRLGGSAAELAAVIEAVVDLAPEEPLERARAVLARFAR